jgi:hypothetical protein
MAKVTYPTYTNATTPNWVGDFLDREHVVPGGSKVDAAQWSAQGAVTVTTTAAAAVNATSLAVTALSGAIPAGTILTFGAGIYATTTADVAAAAVAVPVQPLFVAVPSGASAVWPGTSGKKFIASGTALGRTYAERDAGTNFGPAASTDDQIYLLVHDIYDAADNNDCELYRPGSIVKENFLPTSAAGVIDKVRVLYVCVRGIY